jgi:hypothetical protein
VQSVKKGKFIKFDIEGVQLPDGTNVKLRCVGAKPNLRRVGAKAKPPGQDEIKVDSSFKGGVGAPQGSEYTAYVNEDKEVAVSGLPASSPALVAPPSTPAPGAAPTASTVAPGGTSTTPAAPATSSAISPGQSGAPLAKTERIMVQCFSDPSGADILIDGEFYGNTPSILKLAVGKHELEIQLSGYKTYAIPLILQSDTGIRTIHPNLEPKE